MRLQIEHDGVIDEVKIKDDPSITIQITSQPSITLVYNGL